MRTLLAAACFFVVLTASELCSAQDVTSTRGEHAFVSGDGQSSVPRRWYGWQTFASDGVAAGLFLGAVADDHNTALFGASGLTFAIGAPVVHLSHGQWEMALGSVGLRVVAPLIGAVIGSSQDGKTTSDMSAGGGTSTKWTTTGVAIGGVVASAIDGLVLAYDARPARSAIPAHHQLLEIDFSPHITLTHHGAAIWFTGSL
ncbi:MAG TPA: hypothetical protein VHV51_05265 [Polyangiaceae bacterium]|nr:hypothetical protein [Polyangiaceae bacterium]